MSNENNQNMIIKLNSDYTVEYKVQKPFIQGTDARNKIELYAPVGLFSTVMVSYTYPSGRTSIAISPSSSTSDTLDGVDCIKHTFLLPQIATADSGQLMATFIAVDTNGTHKFNITNKTLKSSDFEIFESALQGTAAEVVEALANANSLASGAVNNLAAHEADKDNPHEVTAEQVGLGNVDNTSDNDKPVSSAQLAALNLKADKSTTYTKAETNALLDGKVDKITPEQPITSDSVDDTSSTNHKFVSSDEKTQITTNKNDIEDINEDIDEINDKIPEQASSSNQLADKNFVNSSIATATATFRGSYNLVSDLQLDLTVTHAQVVISLNSNILIKNENDYVYVQVPTDESTPTQIAQVDRYKYGTDSFEYEYTLNNSGFTSEQWAALNSGATVTNIGKIAANESAINGIKNGTTINSFGAVETEFSHKVNKEYASTYVNNLIENSINGVKGQSSFDSTLPEGHTDLLAEYILKGIAQFSSSGKKNNETYKTTLSITPQGASLVETKDNVTQKSANLWDILNIFNKVDKSDIGYYEISSNQTEITNQDDDYSAGSDYDEIRAEFRKPYCIIKEIYTEDISGYHDNDVYYIKYKTDLYMNNEGQYYHYFVSFNIKNNNTDVDGIKYLKVGDFSTGSGFPIAFTRYSVDLEVKSNKTTAISSSSTDSQYPSAKAVYDAVKDKANSSDIPTSTGDLTNNSGFQTSTEVANAIASALANYALKTYVDNAIAGLGKVFRIKGSVATVSDLPISNNTIGDVYYVAAKQSGYIWIKINNTEQWEQLGETIDLSNYAQFNDLTWNNLLNKPTIPSSASSTTTITSTTVSLTLYYTDNTSETITVMTGASASTITTIS